MKTLAILILLSAPLYAADTNITAKVVERPGKDGKPDVRMETVYRGKTKVLMTLSRRNPQGDMAVTSRSYLVGGKCVMAESDQDGDGLFESVTAFDPNTDEFEVFTRHSDGSVKPVTTQHLDATKRQKAVADDALKKLLQTPDMTDKEIGDLLQENRQKIEDIEKEKKDDHK